MENKQVAALQVIIGLLTGVEGAHFFSARLPSKMVIRKFAENEVDRQNIITAIWESIGLSLGLGGLVSGVSYVVKIPYWWVPFMINVGVTSGMSLLYWNDIQQASLTKNYLSGQRGIF